MNGYDLSKNWFDFCFENPEKISPSHTAIYFFAIEHCNRLGGKEKFGFPSQMTMDAIGIKKPHTYIKYFNDIVDWGFFKLIQKSSNQYSSNIISLNYAKPKNGTPLGKAMAKHTAKQGHSTRQGTGSIIKPINLITLEPNNSEIEISQPKFNFRKSLLDLGVSETIVYDWLLVRKRKKAENTKTAFNGLKNQIELTGLSANECIKIASENSWSGFKAIWVENLNKSNGQTFNNNSKGKLAGNIKAAEQLNREIEEKSRNFVSPMHQTG